MFSVLKTGTYTIICTLESGFSFQDEIVFEDKMFNAKAIKIKDLDLRSKIKLSNGQKYILMGKSIQGHQTNSATFSSEFITEKAEITGFYLDSVVHKQIMPRYYNELSELEKRVIINREFSTYNDEIDKQVVAFSYFWLPTCHEYGLGGWVGAYQQNGAPIGFDSDQDRIKKYTNGEVGTHHARTSAYYDSSGASIRGWRTWYINNSGTYDSDDYGGTHGIVPACDISQDAYVALDSDGYYRILGM